MTKQNVSMGDIHATVWKHILNYRNKNIDDFNPLRISILRRELLSGISGIVEQVARLSDVETRQLIGTAYIGSKANSLNFSIKAMRANNFPNSQIVAFIRETDRLEINEDEIDQILKLPEKFVRERLDYTNREDQENYIAGLVKIYSMVDADNPAFKLDKRAYALALLIIDNVFKELTRPTSIIANDYTHLRNLYASSKLDRTGQLQFSKYSLVTIGEELEFGELAPPRVYDATNDITLFLCGIEDFVFSYLRNLNATNKFKLSLKPSAIYFTKGNLRSMRIEEHLETGRYFEKIRLDESLVTKLYNDTYDTLWINVAIGSNINKPSSITFEELLEREEVDGDHFVTQVLHCEYVKEGLSYVISHLDHEFIFYSLEEYEKRRIDPDQKGGARKRIKTFKIDEANIPLCEGTVLFDVLQMKFKSQELVAEYFGRLASK